jgi:hypothetical protein
MAAVSQCQNNLKQISLGIHQYHDVKRHLPYPRLCPAPWMGGADPYCTKLANANQYTGPAESWWCPYDNRPGSTVADVAAGYTPAGMIFPYVGNDARVFRCPDGYDRTPGSPTEGQRFQVSYALVPQMGGRNLAEYVGATVFEHDDAPHCPDAAAHFTAWPTTPEVRAARHAPTRHTGAFAFARSDGGVTVTR